MNDHAFELVRRRLIKQPGETIFHNTKGDPGTARVVNNRFCRLQHTLGREKMALSTRKPLESLPLP